MYTHIHMDIRRTTHRVVGQRCSHLKPNLRFLVYIYVYNIICKAISALMAVQLEKRKSGSQQRE